MTAATPASPTSRPEPAIPITTTSRRSARVTVDLAAIAANYAVCARAVKAEAAAVIKADAYGLGAHRVAPALARAGARTFFAASLAEAEAARAVLGQGPVIYVLEGYAGEARRFAAADVRPVLSSAPQVAAWAADGAPIVCALQIDTGMRRLGLAPVDMGRAAEALAPGRVALVMSHLACASDPAAAMNRAQLSVFRSCAAFFPRAPRSLAATAGAWLGPDFAFDLVRFGIGLYGDDDSSVRAGPALACPVLWQAPILQVHPLAPGDSVGYGATFTAPSALQAATIAVGYADGVLRSLSGRGYAVLGTVRCRLLGRVSMDMITIDVTDAGAAARPGALVRLLGPEAPLRDMAEAAGTIPYEILTSLRAASRAYVGDAS